MGALNIFPRPFFKFLFFKRKVRNGRCFQLAWRQGSRVCGFGVGIWLELRVEKKGGAGCQGLGEGPLDRGPKARQHLFMVELAASQPGGRSRLEGGGGEDIANAVRTWSCSLSGKLGRELPCGADEMHSKAKEKERKKQKRPPFGKFWNRVRAKSCRRFMDSVKPGLVEVKGDAFANDYTRPSPRTLPDRHPGHCHASAALTLPVSGSAHFSPKGSCETCRQRRGQGGHTQT